MKSLLKIILKTKNEEFLLESWLKYYIALVGIENIIVLDHKSDCSIVLNLYKKYKVNVIQIPEYVENPDWVHHAWVKQNKEFLKQSCHFYTILDTDEFLCFFDYESNRIDNSKLLPFLSRNKEEYGFTTTWIFNHYYGKDYEKIEDVTDFNYNIIKQYAECGKGIVNSNIDVGTVGHNTSIIREIKDENIKIKFCPEFYLLHLQRINFKFRFQNMVYRAKAKNKIKSNSNDELIEIIKNKDVKSLNYQEQYVLFYSLNKEAFLKKYISSHSNSEQLFRTNLLKNFPLNQEYFTEFSNIKTDDKKTFILNLFKHLNVKF
jgi:hypothetical protein